MAYRRVMLSAVLGIAFASIAYTLPQVAVLKTILAAGIDPTTEPPLTAKIEEALVLSGRFQVLDRVSVDQVLKEKEFQVSSGLVSNDEMQRVGNYLGADFVVVAYVSRVGQTYSCSAKMIDVATGQILAQASEEGQGKIDVLLDLANEVAGKLVGGGPVQEVKAPAPRQESGPARVYHNSVVFIVCIDGIGGGGGVNPLLGGAYCYRFNDFLGASVFFGYMGFATYDNRSTFIITAGPIVTVAPWFDFGMRLGYVGYSYDYTSYDYSTTPATQTTETNQVGLFGLNPTMLFKFGRFCLGIESVIGFGGGSYFTLGASIGVSF
jgi:hypothetical protein